MQLVTKKITMLDPMKNKKIGIEQVIEKFGLPPMNRADGTPINAVFGFTNMLVKLIEDYRDDKMIVITFFRSKKIL